MRRVVSLIAVVAAAVLATTAGQAKAGLIGGLLGGSCGFSAPVFAPWGDFDSYYFATNGGFESGSTGWTLAGGAAVVPADNEPWFLSGFGSHALQIPAGGSATISVCYGATYPAARFFVAGVGGGARVHVRFIPHSLLGVLSIVDGGSFTAAPGWNASPKEWAVGSALSSLVGTNSLQVQISVDSGTAQIDDLFIDPLLTKI